jgi:hypothetical protein
MLHNSANRVRKQNSSFDFLSLTFFYRNEWIFKGGSVWKKMIEDPSNALQCRNIVCIPNGQTLFICLRKSAVNRAQTYKTHATSRSIQKNINGAKGDGMM